MAQADLKFGSLSITTTGNAMDGYDLVKLQTPTIDMIEYQLPGTAYGARRISASQQTDQSKKVYEFSGRIFKTSVSSLVSHINTICATSISLTKQQETLSYGIANEGTWTEANCSMLIDFGKIAKYSNGSAGVEFRAQFKKWGD